MNRHRRQLLRLALALLVAGCSGGIRGPLRIGFFGALTGATGHLGLGARNATQLAVDGINAAGGVRGLPVELVVEDYGGGPASEIAAAQRLLRAGVAGVVGPFTAAVTVRVLPLFAAARVPLVSPTVVADNLVGQDDYLIRLNASSDQDAGGLARVLLARGWRRAGVLSDVRNPHATQSWGAGFERHFRAGGGRIVQLLEFGQDQPIVFAALARQLVAVPADGLLLLTSSVDAARVAQQVAKLAPGLALAATSWASNFDLIELGGRSVDGLVLTQSCDMTDAAPALRGVREAYRQRFGEQPAFSALSSFDAVTVLATAARRAAVGEDLRSAVLRTGPFPGVQQRLTIDRFGDAQRTAAACIVRNGRFEAL